jgi:thymidylate kinase
MAKFIVVLGPDGSGKTSLRSSFKKLLLSECLELNEFHWRPGIIPYKISYSPRHASMKSDFGKPLSVRQRSRLVSTLLFLFIYFDFLLGSTLILSSKLRGKYVYYERYIYDVIIDQQRYGLDVGFKLRNLMCKLVIKPDLVVLLDGDPKIIHNRKPELTETEISHRLLAYKIFLNNSNLNVYRLDVTKLSSKECSQRVYKEVLKLGNV